MNKNHPMAMVIEDMGRAAREGRSRRMKEKLHKMSHPEEPQVDPVKAEPELSPEDMAMLESMSVQR